MKISYKKLIDKLNSKINKYTVFAFCISIIGILILLYIVLEQGQFINLTYLIVPVVALASLYIVYLSIEVMQASNRFARGLLKFNSIKREIDDLRNSRNEKLFSDRWSKDITDILKCDVSSCSYLSFSHYLDSALALVRESDTYKRFLNYAKTGDAIPPYEINQIVEYTSCLSELKRKIRFLKYTFQDISLIYVNLIASKELVKSQKQELAEQLDDLARDYLRFSESLVDKETSIFKDLVNIEIFGVSPSADQIIDVRPLFDESFDAILRKINKVKQRIELLPSE